MFIIARFFAGMGSWGFLAVTPVYSAELAPPSLRGLFVGMNGVNIALGYGLASYMGMGMSHYLSIVKTNIHSMVLLSKRHTVERPTGHGFDLANHDAHYHLLRTGEPSLASHAR